METTCLECGKPVTIAATGRGAFQRLGREARPQLAHRCAGVGTAIMDALQRLQ